ncbi:GSCOCG00012225001-RA-CDS, partial [Cotesia congregata]
MIEATAEKPFERSRIICLPFINAPPTDYDTILTSLLFSIEKCKASNQKTCIVTFDQPLYWKARDITAAADPNTDLSKVVVRLGAFHLLMSFIGSIGYIMSGSGLEEIFKLIYAENCVQHIMSGHAYGRAVRAHLLVHLSITKIVMDLIEFTEEERDFLDDNSTDIDRTRIFEAIHNPVFQQITTKFEEALNMLESKGPTAKLWVQYYRLVTLLKHFIEAERSGNWSLHLKTIRNMLPIFHSSGHFLYAKSSHLYLQDMLNLEKIMTPEEFHSFTVLGYFTIRRTDKFWSGIMSDQTIEQTLMKMFKSSGELTHGRGITESTLASWTLGMIRLQDVCEQVTEYCNLSMDTSEQHIDYRDSRIKRDNEDLEKIDNWFATHVFTQDCSELICIANGIVASEDVNCQRAFEIGEDLITNIIGSDFQRLSFQRKNKVLPFSAMTSTIEVDKTRVVINPLLLFQRMCISRETVGDVKEYLSYELAPFPLSLFAKDGMRKGTKSSLFNTFTPVERSSNISTSSHFVIDGGFLLHKVIWDRNSSFKDITTKYVKYVQEHFGLSASIVFDGYSDDPDVAGTKSWERLHALIVSTALAASPLFNTVTIVAEDIDILILLTALGRKQANVFFLKPSKGRTAEQLYSASVDPALLTVIGERFFISLYGGNKDDNSLDSLRYKQFAKAVTKSTFNLSSLPPTQDTARFHTFRVYHQVQSWLGNYNDPEDWGWKKCGKLLMPVQNSKPPAPPELLKLIFCKCK